ncbi:HPr(Ser) kinase/phosphatase [Spiroplasma endosymbiont of Aspidapion aeneum]|uniref:HPr(Ser) kinase/phosphatase n=1 Tax=Spiroplasma endosymbiont of Aspidapion aeneum TaxID=3066276 RepID=UPI00313CC211
MKDILTVKNIKNNFNLDVLVNEKNLDRQIFTYGINRAGLELTGYFYANASSKSKRLIVISTKEYGYMNQFNETIRIEKYESLLKYDIPCIIITPKFKDKMLIEVAKKFNVPILRTKIESTSDFTQMLLDYMDEFFTQSCEVHGTLVNVYGKGVLIIGKSGIGKSEISMELVSRNHLFVGDDRIILNRKYGQIYGKCHPILQNFVEIRGLGIMDIKEIMGHKVILNSSPIDIVIELEHFNSKDFDDYERLGCDFEKREFIGINVPYIKVPVSSGRNTSLIIESAVGKLKLMLKDDYVSPITIINKRIFEIE